MPKYFRVAERGYGIDGLRHSTMRWAIRQHERDHLTFGNAEISDRLKILASKLDGRAHDGHIRPRDSLQRAIIEAGHPGNHGPIVKTQDKLQAHVEPPAPPNDNAHQIVRLLKQQRHEIYYGDSAVRGFETGLQDQSVVAVVAASFRMWVRWRNKPSAMVRFAEQSSEASR